MEITPGGEAKPKTDRLKNDKIIRKFENVESEVLEIHDEDLRAHIVQICQTDLPALRFIKTLKLERCQLDMFAPNTLSSTLQNLSLEGNKLSKLEVYFGVNKDEEYKLENILAEIEQETLILIGISKILRIQEKQTQALITLTNFLSTQKIVQNFKLILNVNPLTELSGLIRYLKNLRVLGIAHSKIQELPPQIANLQNMKQIVVENTPLKVPKLVCAERGFEAIKEFFNEQRQRNQDVATNDDDQNQENKKSQEQRPKSVDSESEDDVDQTLMQDKYFQEYGMKKNKLVSKQFAYAVIDKMQKAQNINLYDHEKLNEYKDKEHEFVQAYDEVLKEYIDQDKLNMLPDFFKKNQMVKQIKDQRRAARFDFPSLQKSGLPEEQSKFVNKLDQVMADNPLNRVIALIRFQNFELFKILIELINKMDIYRLKFVIAYVTTYLDEFLTLCDLKAQIDPKMINFKDEFDPELVISLVDVVIQLAQFQKGTQQKQQYDQIENRKD
ncbi:UNKNOWN [Stylonychia lemnae]|uniref:Uncharacterized protein n=1 Tax=Stylonychia lemnae TaxID=5949 RepID=A0A078B6R1_STYLE|nr:UNKNOWN [Stylonychia lemnae]|eukprot:CDW90230.1 UNKNOWN [Stylonychia lemnae]